MWLKSYTCWHATRGFVVLRVARLAAFKPVIALPPPGGHRSMTCWRRGNWQNDKRLKCHLIWTMIWLHHIYNELPLLNAHFQFPPKDQCHRKCFNVMAWPRHVIWPGYWSSLHDIQGGYIMMKTAVVCDWFLIIDSFSIDKYRIYRKIKQSSNMWRKYEYEALNWLTDWYSRVPSQHDRILHGVVYSTAVTKAYHLSDFEFTKGSPYLALVGEPHV